MKPALCCHLHSCKNTETKRHYIPQGLCRDPERSYVRSNVFFFLEETGHSLHGCPIYVPSGGFQIFIHSTQRKKKHNIFFSHSGALCVRDVHAV